MRWHRRCALGLLWGLLLCAPKAHAALGRPLALRRDGVGPITKTTAVDAQAVRHLFKGCTVSPTLHMRHGQPVQRSVAVACRGRPLVTLYSETDLRTLSYVEVHDRGVRTPQGVAMGHTLDRLFRLGRVDCDAGLDPDRRRIECLLVGHSAFAYQATDTGRGRAGILPPPAALRGLKVDGLVWRASMI